MSAADVIVPLNDNNQANLSPAVTTENAETETNDLLAVEENKTDYDTSPTITKSSMKTAATKNSEGSLSSLAASTTTSSGDNDGLKTIFQKELSMMSVDRYYQTFWADDSVSFLESWLVGDGKKEVVVGSWTTASSSQDDPIVNPYDQEAYDQVRTVTYSYHRSTTSLSPVSVTMTQYCRRMGRSSCMVASTTQFAGGMPYAKALTVHTRWVASRQERVSLRIQVGLNVMVSESVLAAGPIKASTVQEMTQAQLSLFRTMKKAAAAAAEASPSDTAVAAPTTTSVPATTILTSRKPKVTNPLLQRGIGICFPFAPAALSSQTEAQLQLNEARTKLERVRELPLKTSSGQELDQQRQYLEAELETVHQALDAILLRKYKTEHKRNLEQESTADDEEEASANELMVVKVLSQMGKGIQSSWDMAMRKMNHGRVKVRDPSQFVQPNGADTQNTFERDMPLDQMDLIVSSSLSGVDLQDFCNLFLEDNTLYTNWLSQTGRDNIEMSVWKKLDSVDTFSGETFSFRRSIAATFDKAQFSQEKESSSLSVKSTQTQEQLYKMQQQSKRLVCTTCTTVSNIPFADSFAVHTRWVVSQTGPFELTVKVGLAVVFDNASKNTVLLESTIRAGTKREAQRLQVGLWLKIRSALGKVHAVRTLAQEIRLAESLTETPRVTDFIELHWKDCTPRALGDLLEADGTLHEQFENAKLKLRSVQRHIHDCQDNQDVEGLKFAKNELAVLMDALDNILEWHGDSTDGSNALVEAGLF